MTKDRKPFERLPKNVVPVNYVLKLNPDIEKFTFAGEQVITVKITEPTPIIVMNCAEIVVQSVDCVVNGETFTTSDIKTSEDEETLTLTFSKPLPVGTGSLNMAFTGILNDKLRGFYRSAYTSAIDGTKKHIAVTQFESTDARRAFPCWDEPSCKATFDVTLVSPKKSVALSNMPVIKEEAAADPKYKISTYDRTPIMSTYLLAFVIGEFDYVEGKDKNNVLVRVYTPVGKKEQGLFALDVAVKTLPFYNDYFEIPYPLPKMDLIAIPDFSAGAMENWGLVTYRETCLLVDPLNTSSNTKQWVALVVGHELAHQWFGNLVTMEWWTHLWLNEGFASWIEYLCVDYCFPDWNIWLQFINLDFKNALQLDAMDTSHPIEVAVGHPDEVDEIFDHISYCKGNSVIRMLHNFLGPEPFRQGLASYLKKFKYSNTVTEDLWSSLEEISGEPVNKIMSTWTSKMGYPMLSVSVDDSKDKTVLNITQQKFCANGDTSSDFEWLVPISVITQSSSTPQKMLLDKKSTTMVLDNCKPGDWIKVNPDQIGLYRVQYSSEMLQALLPAIKNLTLSAADRLGVQEDLFALAKAGYTSTSNLLTLMGAYVNERDYVVLSNVRTNLGELASLFTHLPAKAKFQEMNRKIFSRVLLEVGWDKRDNDIHTDALLRNMLIGVLGKSKDTEVIDECKKRFANHFDGTLAIPADIRGSVYATVRYNGGEKEYEQLLELFNKTDLHEERDRVQRVLGSGPGADLREKALEFAISPSVRTNDTPFVIASVAGYNHEGRQEAWAFTKKQYDMFLKRYSGGFLFTRLIKTCCADFCNMNKYKEVENFFAENKAPSAERAVNQSLENIKLRASWLDRDLGGVTQWFNDNGF